MKKHSSAHKHYTLAFWGTLLTAVGLIVGGFFTPPKAEIDGSILKAVGLIFLWPALSFAYLAMITGKVARISKGDTTITVGDDQDDSRTAEPAEGYEDSRI